MTVSIDARICVGLLLAALYVTPVFATGMQSAREAAVEAYVQQAEAAQAEGAAAVARGLVSGKRVCFPDKPAPAEPAVNADRSPASVTPEPVPTLAEPAPDPGGDPGSQGPSQDFGSSGDGGAF